MSNPILTIAVSTFNRAERLKICIERILLEVNSLEMPNEVEVLVVDNASTDGSFNFLQIFKEPSFRVIKNSINQGMLGNLNVCALESKGDYVWCIGDDDLILPGMLSVVLNRLKIGDTALLYLNYAHLTGNQNSEEGQTFSRVDTRLDQSGVYTLEEAIQANSNLMTAIYTLVLRRDLAISCFSVVSHDPPFSSLNACVPSTVFALSLEPGTRVTWIAEPVIAVDLRVSWIRYAPIWIIERFPEIVLQLILWSNGRVNLKYILEEMRPGIRYWLDQSESSEFESPSQYTYLRAFLNIYGEECDVEILEKIKSLE
jgi:glycosyltransferase involved in cell wall biosynthesis